jgi:hypothetical protein
VVPKDPEVRIPRRLLRQVHCGIEVEKADFSSLPYPRSCSREKWEEQ